MGRVEEPYPPSLQFGDRFSPGSAVEADPGLMIGGGPLESLTSETIKTLPPEEVGRLIDSIDAHLAPFEEVRSELARRRRSLVMVEKATERRKAKAKETYKAIAAQLPPGRPSTAERQRAADNAGTTLRQTYRVRKGGDFTL